MHFTTYRDIAQRADVAVPTVYKNFPDAGALLKACTRHTFELAPVPREEMFDGVTDLDERIAILVQARCKLNAYFDPWLKWGGERVVPEIVSVMDEDRAYTERLVQAALAPAYGKGRVPKEVLSMTLVLLSYHTWADLHAEGGLSQKNVEAYLSRTIRKLIEK